MLAIDTNLVVRYLTGDHPVQSPKARALLDGGEAFVSTTVLLETEWVLRSAYGYSSSQLVGAFAAFAGLPNIRLEDPPLVAQAVKWMSQGMDFADALHLAKADHCSAFATFDRRFAKLAKKVGTLTITIP